MNVRIEHGDCLEVLPRLAAEGVMFDSVVTDPPYHLTSIVKRFGATSQADTTVTSRRARDGADGMARLSRGFMGKTWDGGDVAFRVETWEAVYRVMKPGAHLVAFGGTRTYHRLACAIEDAGFEIRDQIGWLFGSGFPKSHNVAKGIDKARVEDVEPTRAVCRFLRRAMDARNLKSHELAGHFGGCHPRLIDHWAARDTDSQPSLPTWEQFLALKAALHFDDSMDAEVWRLNGRKGQPGSAWTDAEVLGEREGVAPGLVGMRFAGDNTVRAASTNAATWEGWGTALKPAWEPIVLARKPLIGTVAANVLRHGTGAINIDACRVDAREKKIGASSKSLAAWRRAEERTDLPVRPAATRDEGLRRWPANVIHDGSDEAIRGLPNTESGTGAVKRDTGSGYQANAYGKENRPAGTPNIEYGDAGNAARFFYTAKADAEDRLGSKHPTVKPVDLIAYLCRLITPPGGLILDPFAGSGTTGMACLRESFRCILIEREAEYVADIQRRLNHVSGADTPLFS